MISNEDCFRKIRSKMVLEQIVARGIKDSGVIEAMQAVPRHKFVPEEAVSRSYNDEPLPIGSGQTISQPYMVALMSECLKISSRDVVLEIGTGSGYQTAVLAHICSKVYTMERIESLSFTARQILKELHYKNIDYMIADGTKKWKDLGVKFNAVIITAAAEKEPLEILDCVAPYGRMVVPVGQAGHIQTLMLYQKTDGRILKREICRCAFVPLVNET